VSRLQSLPSRIGAAPARLGRAPADQQSPRRQRDNAPWRAWYGTKAWSDLKLRVHVRDNYTCQRTGVICGGKYPAPDSPVANHIKPHRGNPSLFWDENNIETVTKAEHDSAIQREEQESLLHKGVWD
jgi:5-methylcytosine-specific restriction endonuclease McrA